MPLNIKQLIDDESKDRDYFAMVPAMLWPDIKLCSGGSDADAAAAHAQELGVSLGVHDRWLYVTLKKICGEKGTQCFMSSRGLAKFAGMSTGQLSKSKAKLEEAGLITIVAKKRSVKGWAIDHITVVDIWEQNIQLIKARQSVHLVNTSEDRKRSGDEPICSPSEQIKPKCSPHELKCSPGETEEEPIEEEPTVEEKQEEKPFDSGLDQYWQHCQEAEANQKASGNYAVPSPAGGSDGAAEAALLAMYHELDSEPPRCGTPSWKDELGIVGQVLRDRGLTDPGDAEEAGKLFGLANRETPQFANVHLSSFPGAFGMIVGKVMKQADDGDRRAHDAELTKASLAALEERRAVRPPPPADDEAGRQVKAALEPQVERHLFLRYVAPSRFTCEDGALVVAALDEEARNWLESHVGQIVKRALAGMDGGPWEVAFEVGE